MIGSDASIEVGTAYTDEGATAFDNIDGDITADIATVSDVNTNWADTNTQIDGGCDSLGEKFCQRRSRYRRRACYRTRL